MERGERDRDGVAFLHLPHRPDRVLIGAVIAFGVRESARGFAEHAEAGGEAPVLALLHASDGFLDGAAHHADLAHHAHRRAYPLADERPAPPGDQPLSRARLGAFTDLAASHPTPHRHSVDTSGVRLSRISAPSGVPPA